MTLTASSRRLLCVAFCYVLVGTAAPAFAEGESYTISGEDGYGISDCMHSGNACGRVIADSWCESHGHARALAFGMSGDVTGSVALSDAVVKVAAGDVVIRCGD